MKARCIERKWSRKQVTDVCRSRSSLHSIFPLSPPHTGCKQQGHLPLDVLWAAVAALICMKNRLRQHAEWTETVGSNLVEGFA